MIYDMNARTKKVIDDAMELSASERALVVSELEASLACEDSPEDVEKAWDEEIARRIDDVVSGRVKTRDMDEVLAELEAKHRRR